MNRRIRVILFMIVCLAVALPRIAEADSFGVQISVDSGLNDFNGSVGQINSSNNLNTALLPQTSISGGPASVSFGDSFFTGQASASGSVQMGLLTGAVSASGANSAQSQAGGASGEYTGLFEDTLTVTSNTLAAGSPVSLLFTLDVNSTSACTGNGSVVASATLNVQALQATELSNACNFTFTQSKQLAVSTTVGTSIAFNVSTTLQAFGGGPVIPAADFGNGSASVDPSGELFIDSETSGASYTTASGADYETPVIMATPEPSSLMMLGFGLIWLLGAAKATIFG